jgi:hypothetical protein
MEEERTTHEATRLNSTVTCQTFLVAPAAVSANLKNVLARSSSNKSVDTPVDKCSQMPLAGSKWLAKEEGEIEVRSCTVHS